jgi:GntR family transcriptional regulator, rspAB operon transcriptional repressor
MPSNLQYQLPERDRSRHAAPQVFDYLRDRIIDLDMPPGTLISRQELQTLFGFSSTPIRDALLQLQDESLVEIFPQHATVVSPISIKLAQQAQFLRRSVEIEAIRTVCGLPGSERTGLVARLNATITRQKLLLAENDLPAFDAVDRSFHATLCDAASVPNLWTMIRRQSGHIDRMRRLHLPVPGKAEQILGDHAGVVAAIAAGDCAEAQHCMRDHLSRSLAYSDEMRAKWPTYFKD